MRLPAYNQFMKSFIWCATVCIIVVALALAWSGAPVQAQGTPPQSPLPESALRLPWWVGVLILLLPMGFLFWKSRDKKQPAIKGASCLPVLKEGERPFQIYEDDPAAK